MHDPMTVAHTIKYPWRCYPKHLRKTEFEKSYRESFITIWHVDPEKDGSDDSCGWFQRARHGNPETLEKIRKRFADDWDTMFSSDSSTPYFNGYFEPITGAPVLSVQGIALNLFFVAALEMFGARENAVRFMEKNLFDILFFAENPVDSLHSSITMKYGFEEREVRIRGIASCVYAYILRGQRPWWKHPKWHFWHWRVKCEPVTRFKRWAFSRCCRCSKRFKWGESPTTNNWNGSGPRWFRSEDGIYHSGDCSGPFLACAKSASVNQNQTPEDPNA